MAKEDLSEEDKAKALEHKIKAPLVWGVDRRGIRIEDLQDKRIEEAVDLLKEHFLNHELTYRMVDILSDEEATEEFLTTARTQMKDKTSMAAVKEATGDIIGVIILRVVDRVAFSRTFSKLKITTTDRYSSVMRYYNTVERPIDIHKLYDSVQYIKIFALALKPKYREKGLEKLMLQCAIRSARAYKIYVLAGIFTSGWLQELATELGFAMHNEIFYQKYLHDGNRIFFSPDSHSYGAMFMAIRIPEEDDIKED